MKEWRRWVWLCGLLLLFWLALPGIAEADPLDEAAAKLGSFLQRVGLLLAGLVPAAGGVAVGGLALKRAAAKAMGEEEGMVRASNQIAEVLKLMAITAGSSLLVAIAGSVLR